MSKVWVPIEKRYSRELQRKIKMRLIKAYGGCEICGEDQWGELVVHHKKYRVDVLPEHVHLLCNTHHNMLHKFCTGRDPELPRFTDDFIKLMKQELAA